MNRIISAPFLGNNKKQTIYRSNSDEVTFEIKYGLVVNISKELMPEELHHIQKYIIGKNYISLSEKIISYGSRGLPDIEISEILSVSVYAIKSTMRDYWDDKMKSRKLLGKEN